jgi:hypothetical protein
MERAETLQPARARMRAQRSCPPQPSRVICWASATTTSAARRDGRHRLQSGAHLSGVWIGALLPVEDGVGTDEGHASGLFCAPGQKILDLQDAEALGWGVEGPTSFRELGEAPGQDLGHFPGESGLQLGFLQSGLEGRERIGLATQEAQVRAGGEAKEMGGGEGRAQGHALGGVLEAAAQAQAKAWSPPYQ